MTASSRSWKFPELRDFRARVNPAARRCCCWTRTGGAGIASRSPGGGRARTATSSRPARGPYTLQAAIAACHARASDLETNWDELGRALTIFRPDNRVAPITRAQPRGRGLARVGACRGARRGGRAVALDTLGARPPAGRAGRADLLARLGRHAEAASEFERCPATLTTNSQEQALLADRARASVEAAAGHYSLPEVNRSEPEPSRGVHARG